MQAVNARLEGGALVALLPPLLGEEKMSFTM